ncbi:hypothetical protein H5410_010718, partial [Solanum commersonii]
SLSCLWVRGRIDIYCQFHERGDIIFTFPEQQGGFGIDRKAKSAPCGRPLPFNAATNATSGQTQNVSMDSSTLPTFGKKYDSNSVVDESLVWSRDVHVSDSSILGYPRAPAFGVSNNSHFGTPKLDSYSFGQPAASMSGSKGPGGGKTQFICGMQTCRDKIQEEWRFEDYQLGDKGKESSTPLLKSSGFGKSAFGIIQKGSRTASYISTPDIDSTRLDGREIQSICGIQTYQDISQEELRFEDYPLYDKGQKCGSSFSVSSTQGFGVIDNRRPFISPVFNQSTVDQPHYFHFTSTFAVERAGVDSLSNENSTSFPKSQQSISHIFLPNTSLLNSCDTGSRVESTASDVSFSPWIHSSPFAPFKPASSSSTTSTFSPLRNSWPLSTSAPLSPHSVSPFVSKTIRP